MQKSHLPYTYYRIDKLKVATAMLDHVDHFFGLPTGLFCIGCFTAELGAREAEDLGAGLNIDVWNSLWSSSIYECNSKK